MKILAFAGIFQGCAFGDRESSDAEYPVTRISERISAINTVTRILALRGSRAGSATDSRLAVGLRGGASISGSLGTLNHPSQFGERLDSGFQLLDGEIRAQSVVREDILESPGRITLRVADPSGSAMTKAAHQRRDGCDPDWTALKFTDPPLGQV